MTFLESLPSSLHQAQRRGEEAAGAMLEERAKDAIGREHDTWPALAASTVEEKRRLGYTGRLSETDPLLRTGELRISIGHTVDHDGVTLGSTDPIAPFHEFGTARMPPRPFIGSAMVEHGHEAANIIAEDVAAAMASEPIPRRRR